MSKGWQHNYDSGRKAFDDRKYDLALKCLEKAAIEKNDYADVFNMLGFIYYYNGRFNDAILAFEKALSINPGYTEASLSLSVVYNEIGMFDKGRAAYKMAKTSRKDAATYLDPYVKGRVANMHSALGAIYKDLGLYGEAIGEFKKALALRPEFIDIKTELGVAYRDSRDFDNAVRELSEAIRLNGDYVMSRIQLGLTYYTMGRSELAKDEWLKVIETHPEDKMARMYMTLLQSPSG
jgi:tetratricopeptide (TPR) repeat protein